MKDPVKSKDPVHFGDFRPINLIGSIYKIIAKLLANRLKKVIGNIIDEVQSSYVEGRYILEGLMIVNELCSWAKAIGKKMLMFKADFNKAFDSVNWAFLDSIMDSESFSKPWLQNFSLIGHLSLNYSQKTFLPPV